MRLLRSSSLAIIALAVATASDVAAAAQTDSPRSAPVPVQDGGTRETLESIFIPPMPRAPFTLLLATAWSRPLGNGGAYTVVNQRHIMRDSRGRIYEERWLLVPKGGKIESRMNYIQIADPSRHTLYNCQVERHTCFLLQYSGSTDTVYTPTAGVTGPLPNGDGYRTHENLGNDSIDGEDTTGFRDTTTINPGVFGNDQPMLSTREFWFAPRLGINLRSAVDDPRTGKQTFTVTELNISEPEPQFFDVPEGYKIVDRRRDEAPSK